MSTAKQDRNKPTGSPTSAEGTGVASQGEKPKRQHGTEFRMRDQLIYHVNLATSKKRLCIPKSIMKEVFKLAHYDTFHMGYHRTFNAIVEGLYIRRLAHHLKQYIAFCPQCRMNQTARHQPYGSMVAITSPPTPFHTICMDFIVALPASEPEHFNSILTVTDKFSKAKLLISGQKSMNASEWAARLLDYLRLCNWGIPRATISDRDQKFRLELWRELFKQLKVELLVSTAYHPQTDGLSECSNQTVEIALRYLITSHPDTAWHKSLPAMQSILMNAVVSTTGMSPNQILYRYPTRDSIALLSKESKPIAREEQQTVFRQEAANAICFANAKAKLRYDRSHKLIELNKGDKVYLQLHRGYTLPEASNKKLSNQRVGPFEVVERIRQLTYKLKLPPIMRIYPVVLIAQLEPAEGADPYNRERPHHPEPVEMEEATPDKLGNQKKKGGSTLDTNTYEVEQIIGKRTRKYGRGQAKTEYRVKWLG